MITCVFSIIYILLCDYKYDVLVIFGNCAGRRYLLLPFPPCIRAEVALNKSDEMTLHTAPLAKGASIGQSSQHDVGLPVIWGPLFRATGRKHGTYCAQQVHRERGRIAAAPASPPGGTSDYLYSISSTLRLLHREEDWQKLFQRCSQ